MSGGLVNIFGPPFCGDMFGLVICSPTIYCWLIIENANEVHDVKRHGQKNIQNKAVQTKLNSYINKYMKKETLQIF